MRLGIGVWHLSAVRRQISVAFILDVCIIFDILQPMLKYQDRANNIDLQENDKQELIGWLKVLSEPNRLALLDLIIQGAHCNCDLSEEIGIAPNLISHHLGVLRESGLVNSERDPLDARWIYYTVNPDALEQLNAILGQFLNPERIQPRRLTCGPQANC
jgi:ArsR family transcriptional regulator